MTDVLASFVRVVAFTVAALLPIINPIGGAPIFLSTTPGASEATRRAMARRIATDSLILLVSAMLIGSYVLLFFGLSLAVVKIAGGLLVLSTGCSSCAQRRARIRDSRHRLRSHRSTISASEAAASTR